MWVSTNVIVRHRRICPHAASQAPPAKARDRDSAGHRRCDPRRVFRRLQRLRGWSHDEARSLVFPRGIPPQYSPAVRARAVGWFRTTKASVPRKGWRSARPRRRSAARARHRRTGCGRPGVTGASGLVPQRRRARTASGAGRTKFRAGPRPVLPRRRATAGSSHDRLDRRAPRHPSGRAGPVPQHGAGLPRSADRPVAASRPRRPARRSG